MKRTLAGWGAWTLWLPTVALVWGGLSLGLWRDGWDAVSDDPIRAVFAVLLIVPATVGAMMSARMPRNAIGWVFLAVALGNASSFFFDILHPESGVVVVGAWQWFHWLSTIVNHCATLATLTLPFLLFPTGRAPSRRWAALVWVVVIFIAGVALFVAFAAERIDVEPVVANPFYVEWVGRTFESLDVVGIVTFPFLMCMSLACLLLRFRNAQGVERLQFKWFVYLAALIVVVLAVAIIGLVLGGEDSTLSELLIVVGAFVGTAIGMPAAVGVAILRYRLYDIDRIINRTLVYSTLTATLVLTYVGVILLFQTMIVDASGEVPDIVIAGATLAVAALFQPLRRRFQQVVDRHFYRRRYDAARTIDAFAARLRHEVDLDSLVAELTAAVHETMQPEYVSLWVRPMGTGESIGGTWK